eukprot:5885111-Prymnesium_polylepis.2
MSRRVRVRSTIVGRYVAVTVKYLPTFGRVNTSRQSSRSSWTTAARRGASSAAPQNVKPNPDKNQDGTLHLLVPGAIIRTAKPLPSRG